MNQIDIENQKYLQNYLFLSNKECRHHVDDPNLQNIIIEYWIPQSALLYLCRWAKNPKFQENRITGDQPYLIDETKEGRSRIPVVYNYEHGGYNLSPSIISHLLSFDVYQMFQIRNDRMLERTNLFLYIALMMHLNNPEFNPELNSCTLTVAWIHPLCIDAYRIDEYDGAEKIVQEPEVAIGKAARKVLRFNNDKNDNANKLLFVDELYNLVKILDTIIDS
jgi:hypothetical protein